MLGRTLEESMLVSEKLLAIVSINLHTIGAILVSVIKDLKQELSEGNFRFYQVKL